MPIPSLSSAAKPRSQLGKVNSVSSRSERPDEYSGNATASNRLHKRAASQNPPSDQANSDVTKKRSFLPQRGLPKAVARPAGVAEAATSRGTASQQASGGDTYQSRLRPRSLHQARVPEQDTSGQTPNSTTLGRTQSLRRPGGLAQPPSASSSRIHGRTQSTNTPMGARKEPASTHARASSNVPEAATGLVRTSARLDAMKRSASTRSKPGLPSSRTADSAVDGSANLSQPTEGGEAPKPEFKKPARPAFSTLQQHFTPRKTGKAPTSTFLHAPEPTNHVLPPEVVALQNELLQLHLLYEPSASINKQWELSAQKALQMRFDEVVSLNQVMQEQERFGQEQKNILALREWSGSNALSGLVEYIHALSGPLHEFPSLLDPGGRFFHLVEDFSKWFSQMDEVWSLRTGSSRRGNKTRALGGLSDAWKGEHAAMTRKLTAFSRHLASLPPTVTGSSIAHIVSRCQSLVDGLLAELHIMQATETEAVSREKLWVEEGLRSIAEDIVDVDSDTDEAAWRLY